MDDQNMGNACKCEGGTCTGCGDKPAEGGCNCGTCEGCMAKAAPAADATPATEAPAEGGDAPASEGESGM